MARLQRRRRGQARSVRRSTRSWPSSAVCSSRKAASVLRHGPASRPRST